MAKTVKEPGSTAATPIPSKPSTRGADARRALLDAAQAILPDRAPSTVTGRELAERAGVNYGLVHHYFGTKDQVFRAALLELRAEFIDAHPERDLPDLIVEESHPYLRAIGRSQVDYPAELGGVDDFPIGEAMVASLRQRVSAADPSTTAIEADSEARARAIAMLCLQIGYSTYRTMLLDVAGVTVEQCDDVEHVLAGLYRDVARAQADPRPRTGRSG